MIDQRPTWYGKLKEDASRTPGFTEANMTRIERLAVNDTRKFRHRSLHRGTNRLRAAALVSIVAVLIIGAALWGALLHDRNRTIGLASTPVQTTSHAPSANDSANPAPALEKAQPIKIERLSGMLSEQLPFKAEDVVGITLEDNSHKLPPFEVPGDRLYVILQNLSGMDIGAASVSAVPENNWVPNAYTMTFKTEQGSYAMTYDPSSNTYGTPSTLLLADDQVWMLLQSYVNPDGEWADFDRLSERARHEEAMVGTDQITERLYARSRFDVGGLDYLGWEKKFLPVSNAIFYYDGITGARGSIQTLALSKSYATANKMSRLIFFTADDKASATSDGIRIGLTPYEVIAKLGLPNARTETKWSYRLGDYLRFHLLFDEGKIRFIALTMPT